jgi:hypothetical protein
LHLQQLIIDLGGKWDEVDVEDARLRKTINFTDKKYLGVNSVGQIVYYQDLKQFNKSNFEEIFYDDIFKVKKPINSEELSIEDIASKYKLSDFYDTKIIVDTPEKSEIFQNFIFNLGGQWSTIQIEDNIQPKSVNNTNNKYLFVSDKGEIFFADYLYDFEGDKGREIFYDDIFGTLKQTTPLQSELTVSEVSDVSVLSEFFNTKINVRNEEQSRKIQELIFALGGQWEGWYVPEFKLRGKVNHIDKKYLGINNKGNIIYFKTQKEFLYSSEKVIFYDDIFEVVKSPVQSHSLQQASTTTSEIGNKLPIDTYPLTLKFKYPFFERNDGSRKSPTQSAGELKRQVIPMGINEYEEIRNTKFRGNDGKWYEINIGKGGTWTWKKLNDADNKAIEAYFEVDKLKNAQQSTASSSVQSTPTHQIETQKPTPSFYDLVGRKLDWNSSIYEVVKLKKINPKKIIYEFKNSTGGKTEVNIPKSVVLTLLTQDNIVAGVKLLPKEQQVSENDYSKMSDIELKSLAKDTQEARDSFEFDEPEYAELTTQVGLMIDEMKRRNIL